MKLAFSQVNAKGGVDGYKLQASVSDTASSPTQTAELTHSIPSSALAVIGPILSTDAATAFPIAKSEHLPMISPTVTDPTVVATGQPWTFTVNVPATATVGASTKQFLALEHSTTAVAIIDSQDTSSEQQGTLAVATLQKAHVRVLKTIDVTTGQPDYSAEVAVVKSLNPQAVVVSALPSDAGSIVKTLRDDGVNVPILLEEVSWTQDFMNVAGSAANNVYVYVASWSGYQSPIVSSFDKAFVKISGGIEPGPGGIKGYEAAKLLIQVLKSTGVLKSNESVAKERAAIAKAIASTKQFQGVESVYTMAPGGYFNGHGFFLELKNANVVQVK